jgi:hypothetical protein
LQDCYTWFVAVHIIPPYWFDIFSRYDNVTFSPLLPRWSKSGLRVTLSYLHF